VLEQGSSITGIDIGPNTWHTLVAYEDSALYEVKGQPSQGYDPASDKEFAHWAPEEGCAAADEYARIIANVLGEIR
ncbi:MAG: cupin fold metalloprotein, WbuC family, partial [Chloroflexi bacterium]|nr:cupin fold metalloprotein, WbuC family [Chloroflexota bacterium]